MMNERTYRVETIRGDAYDVATVCTVRVEYLESTAALTVVGPDGPEACITNLRSVVRTDSGRSAVVHQRLRETTRVESVVEGEVNSSVEVTDRWIALSAGTR